MNKKLSHIFHDNIFKEAVGEVLAWRIALFLFLGIGLVVLPHQNNFLGGEIKNYLNAPLLWAWGNFDGQHYLSIARYGYKPLQYFYFPLFPLFVGKVARIFGSDILTYQLSGLIVTHVAFILGLFGMWKLFLLDYKRTKVEMAILLLLLFPTSFYFVSFYTESLFFVLAIWSFYFARRKNWPLAGILAGFAAATRIVGLVLLPSLLIEAWLSSGRNLKGFILNAFSIILLSPLGLIVYMVYLNKVTGDPLVFFHLISIFGDQRASNLVILPQVFYRYIFKIFPNLTFYFPAVFTTVLEFSVGILFLIIVLYGLFKLRLSYWVYLTGVYIIPTLSGSFSSLPRYMLIAFPAFILAAELMTRLDKRLKFVIYFILVSCLAIATMLFSRGYWVS